MRLELASRLGLPKATRSLASASLVGSRLFHMNSPTAAWRRVKLKPPPTSRPKPRWTACAVGFRGMTRGVPRCTFPRDSSGSSSRAEGEVWPIALQDTITRTAIADARHRQRLMALLLKIPTHHRADRNTNTSGVTARYKLLEIPVSVFTITTLMPADRTCGRNWDIRP